MPFKKTKSGKYESPKGKKYTKDQVKAYYATDGFKKKPKASKGKASGRRKAVKK